MSQTLWLLVEWLDEDEVFPSFDVVYIDRFMYKGSDISVGKEILLKVKLDDSRRAKIVRVADNKRAVAEHKKFLERRDQRVSYAMETFMRRVDYALNNAHNQSSQSKPKCPAFHRRRKPKPIVVLGTLSEDDPCDQNVATIRPSYNEIPSHSAQPSQSNYQKIDLTREVTQSFGPSMSQRPPSLVSSTPIPGSKQQGSSVRLRVDKATQTDYLITKQPSLKEIEEMEARLIQLYKNYEVILDHAKKSHEYYETRNEDSDTSSTADETINSISTSSSSVEKNAPELNNIQENVDLPEQMPSTSTVKMEESGTSNAEDQPCTSNDTRVRRMSAQTTDSLDLVPIGDGHAMIPARVLNEIDFRSYTTATRQLLQAIFSRQVLATHSLTGRQSPAHANKPPKKVLDPKLVNDIVKTVVHRCGVSTSLARNCITVKCTDEAKLYRNRQTNRLSRQRASKHSRNDENIMPSSHTSSDEFN